MSVLIITQKNKAIEYNYDLFHNSVDFLLYIYIMDKIYFEQGFLVNEEDWTKILKDQKSESIKIELFNSLCKRQQDKIRMILYKDLNKFYIYYPADKFIDSIYYVVSQPPKTVSVWSDVDSEETCFIVEDTFDGLPVTQISEYGFSYSTINEIQLSNNLKYIGDYAFEFSSLATITLPDSLIIIGNGAFQSCSFLRSIQLPNNVKYLGNNAFSNCKNLIHVELSEGLERIEDRTFANCANLTNIILPQNLTQIENGAFLNCSKLENITLPNGLTTIGENAFAGCYSLSQLKIPDYVFLIGDCAFYDCYALKTIVFPWSLTNIGSYTLDGAVGLETLAIPDTVKFISYGFLDGCINIKKIYFQGTAAQWREIAERSNNYKLIEYLDEGLVECEKFITL